MREDGDIRSAIQEELDRDPRIGKRDIAVSVRDGIVTLAGFARTPGEKVRAEAAAKRIAGVLGVANDIQVRLPLLGRKPDPDIAREAVAEISKELPGICGQICVRVVSGRVTLEGEVEWEPDRWRAENAALSVRGIRSIRNELRVRPAILPLEIKRRIEEAFERIAEFDADAIEVEMADGAVVLKGSVRSWVQRSAAERTAWSVAGVQRVDNHLAILS